MAIKILDSNQAHNDWLTMLDTALSEDTDVVITRHNKPVVTVVAYQDYLAVQDELRQLRAERKARRQIENEAFATMLASERVLAREWESAEEDAAWADL